ncbi:MAG: ketoacyl-ACP synthase III [Bryobacteraceae bacterium]|nr:ketoacyl-ACP synthase III [Bryobacteraceae bacterium]
MQAIEYHLPERVLSTEQLSAEFPEWSVAKIDAKTGIQCRHIAGDHECSSDLAVAAARKLFATGVCRPEDIDYILLCTQSPDYFLPTTACLLQERLGIATTTGAIDINQGCSGFVYGLGLAQGLIETGQAANVLLLTAETYSKYIHARDKSVRTIFGDAAAATLVSAVDAAEPFLGPFVYGTDGAGAENLIVPVGAMRKARTPETALEVEDESGGVRTAENLFMNGLEVFNFAVERVPESIRGVLQKSGRSHEDIDLFVFHQANRYMLDHLRKKLQIPAEKFQVSMAHCGNTVSSTIPIALKHASAEGRIAKGQIALLAGFGVGYSWAATLLRWAA